ncbi:regulatory protein RecX [Glaciecola siphonariae]|uniref:Regulatory protein RecX n=1 Tax=Glaciecola siphonariae TaxID=521012 RepID=A0ABV9LW84_9ALTE
MKYTNKAESIEGQLSEAAEAGNSNAAGFRAADDSGNDSGNDLDNGADNSSDTRRVIRHTITRLLSRREHSQFELLTKLKQKELPEDECLSLIAQFAEKGLQSDQRYIESFVKSAYQRGKGPVFVEQSLQQQDIDSASARDIMQSDEFDWYEAAARVRQKRFGEDMPTDWNDIQKQKRFLQYRGFYQSHIDEVF